MADVTDPGDEGLNMCTVYVLLQESPGLEKKTMKLALIDEGRERFLKGFFLSRKLQLNLILTVS